jgi:Cu/Ag efflux protein CusF
MATAMSTSSLEVIDRIRALGLSRKRRNNMYRSALITQLVLGAIGLAAYAPLAFAVERAGEEHRMVNGVIQKIDESAEKITLKHGPIKDLGMNEAMTMVWAVKDPTMLTGLKVGDKVRFQAENINGQFTLTKIEKAK